MKIEELSGNKIFIPIEVSYKFPDKCAYCLSPAQVRKDFKISKRGRQYTSIGKYRDYSLGVTIKGVPLCRQHSKRSKMLRKILEKVTIISGIVGTIAGAIMAFIAYGEEDSTIAVIIFAFVFSGIIAGVASYLLIRTLLLIKYPDIWRVSKDSGILGLKADMRIKAEDYSELKPSVQGVELDFHNSEYKELFLKANDIQ